MEVFKPFTRFPLFQEPVVDANHNHSNKAAAHPSAPSHSVSRPKKQTSVSAAKQESNKGECNWVILESEIFMKE